MEDHADRENQLKQRHSKVWRDVTNRRELQAAIHGVKRATELSHSKLSTELAEILNLRGDSVLSNLYKTLERFLGHDPGEKKHFARNPERLSALCWAGIDILEGWRGLDEPQQRTLSRLIELKRRVMTQDADFPASFRALSRRLAPPKGENGFDRETLERILAVIPEPASEDDPEKPEFPPHSPRFPATPTREYEIRGRKVWIKDESWNHTGSHKDRWAWEQLVQYKRSIQSKVNRSKGTEPLFVRSLSMISSGSAAFALQILLREVGLPPLRVLVDQKRCRKAIREKLESIGAIVFPYDLDLRPLDEQQVLHATKNDGGIDITSRSAMTADRQNFYDWLVCEILKHEPSHIFVPYGTGDLFLSIVLFLKGAQGWTVNDRRLLDTSIRGGIEVFGAMPQEQRTIMDKLYDKWRPTLTETKDLIQRCQNDGTIGPNSGIYRISDECATAAVKEAKALRINTEESGSAGLGLFIEKGSELGVQNTDKVVIVNTGWLRTGTN